MNRIQKTRKVTGTAEHEYARKVVKKFSEKELFELPIGEKLARMTIQRSIQDVIAECDIAFCPHCKFVDGLETINADDPLRAALDFARENDVTCFVQYDKYYAIVPSFKSDMKGWIDAVNAWDRIRLERGEQDDRAVVLLQIRQ